MSADGQTRIVILGGGFAGCFVAKQLERRLGRRTPVEISLVNRDNYFVFQPLLAEVASGQILPHQVVNPIRRMLRRTRFFESEVDAIDLAKREVSIFVADGRRLRVLPFDHLVLALGSVVNLTGLPGLAQHSLQMKNLGDAFYLRNHVIGCLEHADIEPDEEIRRSLLTFVVVGGGFSGVETTGELQEMVGKALPAYPNIPSQEVKFVLVQSPERILPEVVPGLAEYARSRLESRGVQIRVKTRCTAATADAVLLSNGEKIHTRTLVSTVGNSPHPLITALPFKKERGRVAAGATMAVPDAKGIWALGDCAWIVHPDSGVPYGPTAQNAIRQAKTCADNIVATLENKPLAQFRFRELGKLASIGRRSAVAEVLGLKISGIVAWFFWRTVYLFKLPGWDRRLRVAIDWTIDIFFKRDLTQLKVFRSERVDQAHYEAGEVIVTQGEIGDRFFIIANGQVEVIREDAGKEARVATLGKGEHFGEVALLQECRRTATVRATQPTDVLCIGRGDFEAFARNFNVLRASFGDAAKPRA
jgi:NADH dehydrogenase